MPRLNQRDEAFEWLNKAIDAGDTNLFGLKVSPEWDNIRDDPRFQDVVRRANFLFKNSAAPVRVRIQFEIQCR
jgi:hypothetical protein